MALGLLALAMYISCIFHVVCAAFSALAIWKQASVGALDGEGGGGPDVSFYKNSCRLSLWLIFLDVPCHFRKFVCHISL